MQAKQHIGASFIAALRGLILTFIKERNALIHFIIAILVTIAGLFFGLDTSQWIVILLLFAMVISAEMINTSLEKLADLVEPGYNPKVRNLKDISAGAVLWISMMAAIIGIIIFAPEILALI